MLRSLYSGISGLRAHQIMLDVTGNNIANVNTTGFKASSVQFQDTLSQLTRGGGLASTDRGGENPAQVGLGVSVGAITARTTQGAKQTTGSDTDLMVDGEGFFVVRQGNETRYTRAGSFRFDAQGRLTSPDGSMVMGWTADEGQISMGSELGPVRVPLGLVDAARATTRAEVSGNLPSDAANGEVITRDVRVFDTVGNARTLTLAFTYDKAATSWNIAASDGANQATARVTYVDGRTDGEPSLTIGGVTVALGGTTSYAQLKTVGITRQDGQAAGSIQNFSVLADGTVVGAFSNGQTSAIGRVALATFANPGGLEKTGASEYRVSVNSGDPVYGTASGDGFGTISGGTLEMSNVDLSQEFTNLIVAQRGFQANARIITTSDEVLQELAQLKR